MNVKPALILFVVLVVLALPSVVFGFRLWWEHEL